MKVFLGLFRFDLWAKGGYVDSCIAKIMQKMGYELTLNLTVLHTFTVSDNLSLSSSSIGLIPFVFLISSITVGLFGLFFVIQGQSSKLSKKICVISDSVVFWLFVIVTGAVGNAIQTGTASALNGNMLGILAGGAIGGLIAGIGVLVNHAVGKLLPGHLTILGVAFMAFSFFSCVIEFMIILMNQKLT